MVKTRNVVVKLRAELCERAESIEHKPIDEILSHLFDQYCTDSKRKKVPTILVPMRWPEDWYHAMQKRWGLRGMPHNIRALVLSELDDRPDKPLSQHVDLQNGQKSRKVKAGANSTDGDSLRRQMKFPEDWVERIRERHGAVGTYIKAIVYRELLTWAWPHGTAPSVPRRLLAMLDEI